MSYFQTWPYVARLSKYGRPGQLLSRLLQRFCAKITGHERSQTEIGYSGGNTIDVWCRWCNYQWQIHVQEEPSLHQEMYTMWDYIIDHYGS
jgi:hypothetical protein